MAPVFFCVVSHLIVIVVRLPCLHADVGLKPNTIALCIISLFFPSNIHKIGSVLRRGTIMTELIIVRLLCNCGSQAKGNSSYESVHYI